jgi:hypothetical protein
MPRFPKGLLILGEVVKGSRGRGQATRNVLDIFGSPAHDRALARSPPSPVPSMFFSLRPSSSPNALAHHTHGQNADRDIAIVDLGEPVGNIGMGATLPIWPRLREGFQYR